MFRLCLPIFSLTNHNACRLGLVESNDGNPTAAAACGQYEVQSEDEVSEGVRKTI